jgi:hypothetical protein
MFSIENQSSGTNAFEVCPECLAHIQALWDQMWEVRGTRGRQAWLQRHGACPPSPWPRLDLPGEPPFEAMAYCHV